MLCGMGHLPCLDPRTHAYIQYSFLLQVERRRISCVQMAMHQMRGCRSQYIGFGPCQQPATCPNLCVSPYDTTSPQLLVLYSSVGNVSQPCRPAILSGTSVSIWHVVHPQADIWNVPQTGFSLPSGRIPDCSRTRCKIGRAHV